MKHTLTPWQVFEGPEDRPELTVVYEDKTGQLVMVCDCLSRDVPPKERKSNAHLIAAAPEMAQKLRGMLPWLALTSKKQYAEVQALLEKAGVLTD